MHGYIRNNEKVRWLLASSLLIAKLSSQVLSRLAVRVAPEPPCAACASQISVADETVTLTWARLSTFEVLLFNNRERRLFAAVVDLQGTQAKTYQQCRSHASPANSAHSDIRQLGNG